jgi:hypothetical protein
VIQRKDSEEVEISTDIRRQALELGQAGDSASPKASMDTQFQWLHSLVYYIELEADHSFSLNTDVLIPL